MELIVEDMGKASCMKEWVQGKVMEERNLRNTEACWKGILKNKRIQYDQKNGGHTGK